MRNLFLVAILNRANDLLKEPPCLVFVHPAPFENIVEQLVSRIFHDQDDFRGRRHDFVELADMRMLENAQVLDFPTHPICHFQIRDSPSVDQLYCNLVFCKRVDSH